MSEHPYAPSWVDRLTDRIDRLAVPASVVYVIAYVVGALLLHLAAWIDGALDWGTPEVELLYNGIWAVIAIGVVHSVDHVAVRAFDRFRPLLDGTAADDLEYRLTTMPARTVLTMTAVAGALVTGVYASSPDFVYEGMSSPASWLLGGIVVVWAYSFVPILVFHLVRQLVLVRRAFAAVNEVSALHQQPLYGLSRVPFASGIAFLVIVNVSVLDMVVRDTSDAERYLNVIVSSALVVLAFAAFLVPLQGIHQRLKRAKEGLLEENGRHVEIAQQRLYVAVEQGDRDGVTAADAAISSLYRVRDEIARVRTWPWSPGTVRSFLSAVFVPMVVWGLQLFGDRIF